MDQVEEGQVEVDQVEVDQVKTHLYAQMVFWWGMCQMTTGGSLPMTRIIMYLCVKNSYVSVKKPVKKLLIQVCTYKCGLALYSSYVLAYTSAYCIL